MSDISGPDQPTKLESEDSATVFDKEIGDDWGEAFEADEFMQAPGEGDGSDFFLDENESTPEAPASVDAGDASALDSTATRPSSFGRLNPLVFLRKYGGKFRSSPLLYRIALPAVLLLIIVAVGLFLAGLTEKHPDVKVADKGKTEAGQDVTVDLSDPEAEIIGGNGVDLSDEPAEPTAAEAVKVRKSWKLPSFLISAKDNMNGDDIFFVEVDISLVFLLDEDEVLPTSHAVLVRDIIYQFFTNRPVYELRRYSLARGEMNRKLRGWIEKQWSERHIATIVFNRYQVL